MVVTKHTAGEMALGSPLGRLVGYRATYEQADAQVGAEVVTA